MHTTLAALVHREGLAVLLRLAAPAVTRPPVGKAFGPLAPAGIAQAAIKTEASSLAINAGMLVAWVPDFPRPALAGQGSRRVDRRDSCAFLGWTVPPCAQVSRLSENASIAFAKIDIEKAKTQKIFLFGRLSGYEVGQHV